MAVGAAASSSAQLGRLPAPFSGRWTAPPSSSGLPNLSFGRRGKSRLSLRPVSASRVEEEQQLSLTEPEAQLMEALIGIQGRGRKANAQQLQDVERAVQKLENLEGVSDPTSSNLIEGRWQLMFTTRPGTASPIQRTFVGVDVFKIFQEVYLRTDDPRVLNVVRFSDAIGELKVEAAATINDGKRILFRFDRAAFSFKFLPFKVPYPVPFRLLGDEAKGWLDTTYLSSNGNIRISRGNKGTTFVLQKECEPRQRLLSAISIGKGVEEIIQELISSNRLVVEGESDALQGEWQLLWASQSENESWSSLAAYGLKGFQIIQKDGQLENLIDSFPSTKISGKGSVVYTARNEVHKFDVNIFKMNANNGKTSDSNLYHVQITDGAILLGGFQVPLEASANFDMELLYIDNKIRITKIRSDITLVHLRLSGTNLK